MTGWPIRRGEPDVYIERVQVEAEGFLANLDVQFVPGLNVIIGARGTGKTSLIELVRFALGASAFTDDAATKGQQQAIAVLEGGAVTVTINHDGERHTITRSASGHLSASGGRTFPVTVLAQNEVEAVGAQASGRLHLIDRFREDRAEAAQALLTLQAQVRSATVELEQILRDGIELSEQIAAMAAVPTDLTAARAEQQRLLASAKATDEDRQQLLHLQQAGQSIAAEDSELQQVQGAASSLAQSIARVSEHARSVLPPWTVSEGQDLLAPAREIMTEVKELLGRAQEQALAAESTIAVAITANAERRAQVDEQSRRLRQSLELLREGVGVASRRVAELEERQGQLNALQSRLSERRDAFRAMSTERDRLYGELDDRREEVFRARAAAAETLNGHLGPNVRVAVTRSEDIADYRSAVVAALRGSGLHYNTLAGKITETASPLELASWVEQGRQDDLVRALDIAPDRAAAIISALRAGGLADVISSSIDDGVTLSLLAGREYKPSDRLSIGQRCTVVLPVLLGHHGDPLIVDQPEDHLDNAFVASTLVPALLRRGPSDQFIFSSHNANIPVLGEANRVIVMDSDGERGYDRASGPLDSSEIVEAVSRIMEGGVEAFAARSRFYEGKALQAT